MNKLVPFSTFSKKIKQFSFLNETSVVVDQKNIPLGFVFGRDSFIALLEHLDNSFEEKVKDPKEAYNNPAGKLIDLIEEKLPLNPNFVKDLKASQKKTKKSELISLEEVVRSLHA